MTAPYFKDAPAGQIRLATPASDQTFVDVPKTNPFFPQIEGMADAGYVIGIDPKHFAPDRPITREELVAIQVGRYSKGATPSPITSAAGMYCVHLSDAAKSPHRIFGTIRTLHPEQPATRAEVAVALQKIAGRNAGSQLQ